MPDAIDTGLYLLTQTHVGTGQAAGAIDLPIARERHTGHPFIPSTAIKGVLRDAFERHDVEKTRKLFGPSPPKKGQAEEALFAGTLVLTDAHLLAFPLRSLSAPFYWATCPLAVARWRRLRRAWSLTTPDDGVDAVSATFTTPTAVVLEDHLFTPDRARAQGLQSIAKAWEKLLPPDPLARRMTDNLVCIPDREFSHLVQTCTSVHARVQLTPGKTTDTWRSEDGEEKKGNLWYEETLPSDCLFSFLMTSRNGDAHNAAAGLLRAHPRHQVGGNETIGHGVTLWTPEEGA
ncbi:MAG TPA: type III-B CRISPR module RAMP protein Cmr4 [Myxococcota bacterium]|nr:type III-B CRISPR module RAMP protein Cmr4 [Myxococcota bacterium]